MICLLKVIRMNALIYVNKEKDKKTPVSDLLKRELTDNDINWQLIDDNDLSKAINADVLFVLGGDGTILSVVSFACQNNIPIIGINTGKLGYLTEFEPSDIKKAVFMAKHRQLTVDKRILLSVQVGNEIFDALNDVVVQRVYDDKSDGLLVKVNVKIDGVELDVIKGDGVIIASPTGSTAYSLSAGGAILATSINAFTMTPVSAHSLFHRPVIFSANSICELTLQDDNYAGLFIDGHMVRKVSCKDKIMIKKSSKTVSFLRIDSFNFYKRLVDKLKFGDGR